MKIARPPPLQYWRRWALQGFIVAAALAGAAAAQTPAPSAPEFLFDSERLADDDPRAALAQAEQAMAGTLDGDSRFWWLLAAARIHGSLEDYQAQRRAVAQAAEALAPIAAGRPHLGLWLELAQISASINQQEPQRVAARLEQLKRPARRQGDARLRCEIAAQDLWLMVEGGSFDEAWLAAEEVERCARNTGLRHLEPVALAAFGNIMVETKRGLREAEQAIAHFERALLSLRDEPARFRRSLIQFDIGHAYIDLKRYPQALEHLNQALALSRSLQDRAGIAAALIAIARVRLESEQPTEVPALLDEARSLLVDHDDGARMISVASLRVRAATQAKRSDVLAEIDAARRWDLPHLQPAARVRLARAMAEGYASQAQWARAYAELDRADKLDEAARRQARDTQVLRLQSRYENVRRDAENAELRHRSEAAALALEAQTARQRALWLAVVALGVLAVGIGSVAWRALRRRRSLLDLALKDPLTGAPNRRAVTAFAQRQLKQTQELGVPLSLAMIDLDHFKSVNDRHGHAAGDALLRAFVAAAGEVLRGQDRLGRWGGEEWLLVMPGTPAHELPHLFDRLRARFVVMEVPGMPKPHGSTFSMGGATRGPEATTLQALIELADRRLYQAKAAGRDTMR